MLFFPKKLGQRAFVWIFTFYVASLLALGLGLHYILRDYRGMVELGPLFDDLNRFLIFAFWIGGAVGALFFTIFLGYFFSPLKVLIEKSALMRKGKFRKGTFAPLAEHFGEWTELDMAIHRIYKDLKKRSAEVDRERSEVEALVSVANDAILAVDGEDNVRYLNDPMSDLLQLSAEESLGKPLGQIFNNQQVLGGFQWARTHKAVRKVQTQERLNPNSPDRFFDVSISGLPQTKKSKGGAIAIFHDMTEHKRIEKIRMDFVANASHELKTPMTSARGYINMLKASESLRSDPMSLKAISGVDKNLLRLQHLVSDLLHLTKIESEAALDKDWLAAEPLTETLIEELAPLWQEKQQNLKSEFGVSQIFGKSDVIETVLLNLISNGIKYCPPHSEIRVSWSEDPDAFVLRVKDNGPGIESHHLSRIFERFYRVRDGRENGVVEGTGLGLSIVRHGVLVHGGEVDVKSAPGLGTEFVCRFPRPKRQIAEKKEGLGSGFDAERLSP